MSVSKQPLTLRLPFAMADQHLRLEQVLAAGRSRSWAQSLPLVSCFALSRPEKRFAKRLLETKRNLWLFRCNQRGFCGDFIVVDMSTARPDQRFVAVIELKSRGGLTFGGGKAGVQFRRVQAAKEELAETTGVVAKDTPTVLVCGGSEPVLKWFEGKTSILLRSTYGR